MTNYPKPTETQMAGLERIMGENAIVDALSAQVINASSLRRTPLQLLYAHAVGEISPEAVSVDAILADQPAFRAAYQRMLKTHSLHYFPAVRAASTGSAPHREVAGCQIDLSEDDGQVFVVIELSDEATKVPKSLTVFSETGIGRRVALPESLRGIIHFPIVEDDELEMLLRDPNSEVYLV